MTARDRLPDAIRRLTDAGIDTSDATLEARLLIRHALNLSREAWHTRGDEPLSPEQIAAVGTLIARRATREPLAHILGEWEFYGRPFYVTPATLIPRPETELLVEAAREMLAGTTAPRVADIGTGSGCVAISLAKLLPDAIVFATDISQGALEVARRNAERHGATIDFRRGDLLEPLPGDVRFDAIVSNPPYIAADELDELAPEVRDFEPRTALFDRLDPQNRPIGDGLEFYRRLAADSRRHLAPGGALLVEVGHKQAGAVAERLRRAGFEHIATYLDFARIPRIVSAR